MSQSVSPATRSSRPSPPDQPIAFIDLAAQRRRLGEKIDRAVMAVVNHGKYIMGPEVTELESQLAQFAGVKHAVSCASGTDALFMVLLAWRIGPGDAVLVPTFTFAATAEVVALCGATPVFCDVLEDTFNLDPASLEAGIETAKAAGLNPRAVIGVDLFGQPADYRQIAPIARAHGLRLLVDGAQSYGAKLDGACTAAMGDAATTSFFPAKPLGCYGDGGAIFTRDDETLQTLQSLRVHGQGSDKYDNVRIGVNGRLDTLQAAILLEKLVIFPEEIERRNRIAQRYCEALSEIVDVPPVIDGASSVWAQYTVRTRVRGSLAARLKEQGIPTAIYYPLPLHLQTAYRGYPTASDTLPVSEELASEVLSLPMHPYLDVETQEYIIEHVRGAI